MVAPASATHFNGWYVSVEGGASWVDDIDHVLLTTFNGFTPTFTTTFTRVGTFLGRSDFDTGWAAFASVGYGFGGGFRGELEFGYRDNDGNGLLSFATPTGPTPLAFATTTAPYSVELSQFTIMANLIYDIRFSDRFSLSVGAGVGADHMDYDVAFLGATAGDSEWKFAWQGLAGLNVRLAPQTQLFLNYRYLQVEDIDDRFFPAVQTFGLASFQDALLISDDSVTKHAATIGLRFDLAPDYVAPPPAPPPPPPPPPPEPPPAPREFIVFFGHDKANLTPEAMNVVREAASAYKATGSANVRVVGHTDRSGSDAYNQELAMRRANAVRGALVGEGVADGSISVDGRGESDPMVPTDDGVREPQNRRVNITV